VTTALIIIVAFGAILNVVFFLAILKLFFGFTDSIQRSLETMQRSLENLKHTIEMQMQRLSTENSTQLERMRTTVDEKLHATLERRLSSAFQQVGDRLDAVKSGLGDMQRMATEVGNLQRILTTVKSRGVLGETQLERILEDILTPDQFAKNVKTKKNSNAFIEFAIKLPNKTEDNHPLWLPIDAKFPTEDYHQLLLCHEENDFRGVADCSKKIEQKMKIFARDIKDKYIDPPNTTNFAIMFLPTEGLYSEVLRIGGLCETLRRDMHIVVSGPSTVAALLNSLQVGFKTLAVEKRAHEVSRMLGAVKADFGKFNDLLEKTQKKLDEASKQISEASHRSNQITRKLSKAETVSIEDSEKILLRD